MRIDIILCEPQHPGNIGFVARAMKTMGFTDLVIVGRQPPALDEARMTAVDASDVLERSRSVPSLHDLLDEYHFLVAFTARSRKFRNQVLLPDLPSLIEAQSTRARVGFVFGRESSGLTNEEIKMCQSVVCIPTGKTFHSLNLSHAVQIACYEWVRANTTGKEPTGRKANRRLRAASGHEREAIFEKLDQVNAKTGLNAQESQKISKLFRILFEERALQKREAGAIHRFLDQILHTRMG